MTIVVSSVKYRVESCKIRDMKESYSLPERLFWSAYLFTRVLGQKHVPYWPPGKLEKVRNARVRKIVRFASRNVPYYRELFRSRGLRHQDFRTVDDLYTLPVLTPLQVRKNPEMFKPDRKIRDTFELVSSGTTGVPRLILHDAFSLFTNAAHGERIRLFYPASRLARNFKEAVIDPPVGSSAREVQRYNRLKAWFPKEVKVNRRYFSMLDDVNTIIKGINEFKPDVIWSYGSSLNIIFSEVCRRGISIHSPGSLIYASDSLSPAVRKKIIDQFGIPVFSVYGSVEFLQLGFECEEHRGYHLNEDCYPVRVVDDDYEPLPDGNPGRVIASNLINRATLLLNYELGDEGTILPERCECGRTQRMLSLNISRVVDHVDIGNGVHFHPITFAEAVYKVEGIWQHQVVQRARNEFDVYLVADPEAEKSAMKKRLEEQFEEWFKGKIRVNMKFVDQIGLTSRGKQRAVVLLSPEEGGG